MSSRLAGIAAFSRAAVKSRLAWILVCLHACWFFLAMANMSPPSRAFAKYIEHSGGDTSILAGRPFHFAYESLAMQLLFLADMPSTIAIGLPTALLVTPVLHFIHPDLYSRSYVGAAIMLISASCQWLAIGTILDRHLLFSTRGKSFLEVVRRSFPVVVVLVLLATAIVTPLVNEHSRKLAARHHAIPSE